MHAPVASGAKIEKVVQIIEGFYGAPIRLNVVYVAILNMDFTGFALAMRPRLNCVVDGFGRTNYLLNSLTTQPNFFCDGGISQTVQKVPKDCVTPIHTRTLRMAVALVKQNL